jgi:hypothetical protein
MDDAAINFLEVVPDDRYWRHSDGGGRCSGNG